MNKRDRAFFGFAKRFEKVPLLNSLATIRRYEFLIIAMASYVQSALEPMAIRDT